MLISFYSTLPRPGLHKNSILRGSKVEEITPGLCLVEVFGISDVEASILLLEI